MIPSLVGYVWLLVIVQVNYFSDHLKVRPRQLGSQGSTPVAYPIANHWSSLPLNHSDLGKKTWCVQSRTRILQPAEEVNYTYCTVWYWSFRQSKAVRLHLWCHGEQGRQWSGWPFHRSWDLVAKWTLWNCHHLAVWNHCRLESNCAAGFGARFPETC